MFTRLALTLPCLFIAAMALAQAPPDATGQDFATLKATHIEHLKKELACFEAATTLAALQACRPHPPGHMGPHPHGAEAPADHP